MKALKTGVLAAALLTAVPAMAQVHVGVILSLTGPAASLGIPEKKTVELFPKTIDGQAITYTILDDGSDPTTAVKDARQLIEQDHVDVILGPSITPNALAIIDVVAEKRVPDIAIVPSISNPVTDKTRWVFSAPQSNALMAHAVVENMLKQGYKKVAFIGFSDAYGEGWWKAFSADAKSNGIDVVDKESYARTATSVTGQALHILAAKPQAVLVAASGTPAALPARALKQVGFKGQIYQTHGVANPDFLRVCGADCNGTLLPVAPGLVASQLPQSTPFKAAAVRMDQIFEKAYGNTVSQFTVNAWDSGVLLEHALPVALKVAKPADKTAFRAALRDALEGLKDVPGADGIYTMSATDHNGLDARAVVMVRIENGAWKLVK
ncbi:ABC transporter substrate-binding protein [Thiomonas sp. FB-Cd]|uniref:ABC transporter substrate-binding protein n=1 Tax=Thiomonas sp. FB-Cd TaxID=1158292 RepID=UPI0004DF3C71|nr:ABC transporter substrate-binding protein [Thiomonas sp. FB-Cd]